MNEKTEVRSQREYLEISLAFKQLLADKLLIGHLKEHGFGKPVATPDIQ